MRQGNRRRFSRPLATCGAACLLLLTAWRAEAQVPLSAVNDETTVDGISFKMVDHRTFEDNVLEEQIWHKEAGFWDKVSAILPFMSAPDFPFDPIELQKDVVRLRHYYQRNGYLHPIVDYAASQVDTTKNRIHIIFSITEGPPLIIQDVGFFGTHGGYMVDTLSSPLRESWIAFRDRVTLKAGTRFTEFEGIRLQDEVLTWWKNMGFAFTKIGREQDVDSTANTVDLRLLVDPGPRGYISDIQIEGNESVSDQVVLRELPFTVGDRYSAKDVSEGQREIFALNLFRVAVAELPDQPRDSTVTVRYRLRESNLRHFTAETGASLDQGATVDGDWTHRNFFGGARQMTVSATFVSGFGAAQTRGFQVTTQKKISATLNQPYLFTRMLSGSFSPSYSRQDVPIQRLKFEETAFRTSLLYTIYAFRTVSLQHTIAHVTPLGDTQPTPPPGLALSPDDRYDVYNRNILTLSAELGKVDDFLRPSSGFRIRPLFEMGGTLISLSDDVDYLKVQTELLGYLPLPSKYNISGRLFLGRIWPQGESQNQTDPQVEFRFDRIRFYAGGSNDVRGWPVNLLGPMQAIAETTTNEDGTVDTTGFDIEPTGGLGKVAANIELRTPFALLGPAWRGAVFLDMGGVFPSDIESRQFRLRDISPADMRLGAGVGLRYETMVGFIRLDLGYKINPSAEDLATPEEVWRIQHGELDKSSIRGSFWDRIRLHLSIGQAF